VLLFAVHVPPYRRRALHGDRPSLDAHEQQ
jgi:hypothetical protein